MNRETPKELTEFHDSFGSASAHTCRETVQIQEQRSERCSRIFDIMRYFLKHCGPRVLSRWVISENLPTAIGLRSPLLETVVSESGSLVSESTSYAPDQAGSREIEDSLSRRYSTFPAVNRYFKVGLLRCMPSSSCDT